MYVRHSSLAVSLTSYAARGFSRGGFVGFSQALVFSYDTNFRLGCRFLSCSIFVLFLVRL